MQYWIFKEILSNAVWWVLYRTFKRFHVIKTGLEPGYYEKSNLIVFVNFRLLVDYVELELGNMAECSEWEKLPRYKRIIKHAIALFITKRNRKAGMQYVYESGNERDHSGSLTPKAKYYREMQELFNWWINTFPQLEKEYGEKVNCSPEEQEKIEDEIDNQLSRLINLRRGMWT
jgi:hypothetical protein